MLWQMLGNLTELQSYSHKAKVLQQLLLLMQSKMLVCLS